MTAGTEWKGVGHEAKKREIVVAGSLKEAHT